jgi:lysophospholipid acyltransferase (LPLAT)-like uncharacterized protein
VHRQLKVDILIPFYYNEVNGIRTVIEEDKHGDTLAELFEEFGGYTVDYTALRGSWLDTRTGKKYENEKYFTCWIVCDKNPNRIHNLRDLKKRLKKRYDQKDMMIYYIIVQVI